MKISLVIIWFIKSSLKPKLLVLNGFNSKGCTNAESAVQQVRVKTKFVMKHFDENFTHVLLKLSDRLKFILLLTLYM